MTSKVAVKTVFTKQTVFQQKTRMIVIRVIEKWGKENNIYLFGHSSQLLQ